MLSFKIVSIIVGIFFCAPSVTSETTEDEKRINSAKAVQNLMNCIEKDDYNEVFQCLEKGAPINAMDWFGDSPLHRAVAIGNSNIVNLLLNFKADCNSLDGPNLGECKTKCFQWTPLHRAVIYGQIDSIKLLIKAQAN